MVEAISYRLFRDEVQSISAERTSQILASEELTQYQLVDVRQPGEYAKGHLPGALLIPLGELADRVNEIDTRKRTIVYCRSGARSTSACQILTRLGVDRPVDRPLNMTGGINSYHGEQVERNVEAGLEFFMDSHFDSAYQMVFAMEAGLKNFYLALADEADNESQKTMLVKLAQFEDGHHMTRLWKKFGEVYFDPESSITEGGIDVESMILYF